jgi:uncharacterized membrane protein
MKIFQSPRDIKSRIQLAMPFDLRFVLIFTLLSIIFVLVPPFNQTPIRIPLALPLLFFIPGYSLVSLLFPGKDDLTGIERLTLSIVLSIAIAIFDGFALNYTLWGVRPAPIVISLSIITLLLLLITCILRNKISEDERFSFDYHVFLKSLKSDGNTTKIEKALIVALIASIIIASGIMIYEKLTFPEEKFTAFYILGEGDRAENYTTDLYLGRSTSITVGIENHEHTTIDYTLQTKLSRSTVNSQKITLDPGEKWRGTVSFIVNRVGPRVKLEFLLYKEGSANPDKSLHLWVASHIDYENLEILKNYTMAQPPEIRNRDMALESDWVYTSNNISFRGVFFNSRSPASPENSTIRGYITDTITGLPVVNASIEVSNHYGYENRSLTNKYGYYELKTIADHLWLDAWWYGYEEYSTEFNITDEQILVLNMTLETLPLFNVTIERLPAGELPSERLKVEKLPPEKLSPLIPALTGYVTDTVTDLPIANAHVIATNYRGFEERATTNERGYFEMTVIPEYLRIEAKADGYTWNRTSFNVSEKRTINLKLTPEHSTVNGYIFDAVGEPIANVRIRVGDHAEHRKQTYYNDTVSDATGYYEISTIAAGHMWIDASNDSYFSNGAELDTVYGETKKIDMRLDPMPAENARVSGYVFYDDTGLGGVKVVVSDHDYYEKSTFTDSSGYYRIYTVPGRLWLDVHPQIYMNSMELDIADGQTRSVNIRLDASPIGSYRISYPSETRSEYGYYGAIYQDVESAAEGIAVLSFKVSDSYTLNKDTGYHFKQVLLNDVVIWEDDVAGDEGWQQVKIPISLEGGKNRIMLRVYEKQGVGWFSANVWWDDVRIESISTLIGIT